MTCEDEITQKLKLFVEGKTLEKLFQKYATKGFIFKDGMKNILIDAGVGYFCRWPSKVISKFDSDGDGKLSLEEIKSNMQN